MNTLLRRVLFAVCLCVGSGVVLAQKQIEKVKIGDELPQFTIRSEVHGTISSSDLKGKVVLISLFATWCPPCQKELAEIEKVLYPKFKGNKDFRLLVLGREHTDDELIKYNQRKKFTFPLYPDAQREVFSLFADQSIPRTYLFGKDGKLVYASSGYTAEDFDNLMKAVAVELEK